LQQGSGNAVYPVHLQKIKKDKGNVYRIKFHTPKPPLVLDYDSLPKNIGSYGAMTNHSGFIVANESYRVPITSVKVISDDTVEIETAEVVPENQGFHVSYIDMRNYPYFESPLLNKTIQQYTESVVDSGISFEIKVDGILNPIPTGSSVRTFYCQTTSAIFHIDNIRHDVSTNSTFLSGDFRKNISDLPLDRNYAGQKFSVGCGRNLFTGNLRDSDDREPIYSAINFYGQEKKQKLHNWALSFSWPLDSTLANKLLLRRQEITSNVGLQASTQR
jgi:hypothetical protein